MNFEFAIAKISQKFEFLLEFKDEFGSGTCLGAITKLRSDKVLEDGLCFKNTTGRSEVAIA